MRGVLSTNRLLRKATQIYETTIGDNASSSFTLTPGFGTQKCVVEVSKVSDGEIVGPLITKNVAGGTQVTISFGTDVPSTDQFRVVIVGPLL